MIPARRRWSRTGELAVVEERELYTDDVRAWLAAVPAPAPRLDIDRTVATGRIRAKRRRSYRIGTGVAAAVVAVVLGVPAVASVWRAGDRSVDGDRAGPIPAQPPASAAPAAKSCTETPLGRPEGLIGEGTAIPSVAVVEMDPTGRYIAGTTYAGGNTPHVAVLWDNGVGRILPVPGQGVRVTAIAANGTVLGSGVQGNGLTFGWIYRNQKVTKLKVPSGYVHVTYAEAINAAGDVVGNVSDAKEQRTDVAVWPAATPDKPRILTQPTGKRVVATGILDDGTVVGWITGMAGAYVWGPDGRGRELPSPPGTIGGKVTAVRGRWAVGIVIRPLPGETNLAYPSESRGELLSARWDLSTGTVELLPPPPGPPVPAGVVLPGPEAVNAGGDAVWERPYPAVLRAGRFLALPQPAGAGQPHPVAVNDDGTVVAGTIDENRADPNGLRRPVVWRC